MGAEFRKEVGVVVQGVAHINQVNMGQTTPSGPQVLLDEIQFYKLTGMRASAPARVALHRLLQEDVHSHHLRRIWQHELNFSEPCLHVRVTRFVPWLMGLMAFGWSASVAVLLLGKSVLGTELLAAALANVVVLSFFLCWFFIQLHRPYLAARRVAKVLNRVNEELPDLLRVWRANEARRLRGLEE